jgi:four helix bundle protein
VNEEIFKDRTKKLALQVIELVNELPQGQTVHVISSQLLRSATSIGANYRAACRGKSTADVLARLAIVEEEADESIYWLELLKDSKLVPEARLNQIMQEANEITAMIVASIKTLRSRGPAIQNPKSKI